MKYDVFISHSSSDVELAEQICGYLEKQDIKCWIDTRNVAGKYAKAIMEGIQQSEIMLLIYSEKANASSHVENEIDNAFCMGKTIIPFRIENTPYSDVLRYYLNKTHYVDGIPEPLEVLEQLCAQIKHNLSEQKRLESIDEAFHIVAQWANISTDVLRECLKNLNKSETTRSNENELEKVINDFIENEFSCESKKNVDNDCENASNTDDSKVPNNDNSLNEGRYDIVQNAFGEILIIINYHESEPDNPRVVYDGTDTALLYRNKKSAVLLESITTKAKESLMKVDKVLIVEVRDDDVVREYNVPMRKIRSLSSLY